MFSTRTKSSLVSPKFAKKKRRQLIGKLLAVLVLVIIIIGSAVYAAHSPVVRITSITIEGNHLVSEKDVTDVIRTAISGNYALLFPKDVSLWFPSDHVRDILLSSYVQIDDVHFEIRNLNTLVVTVSERKPYALWCEGEPVQTDACYLLDREGMMFAKAASFSENVFFYYYGGDMNNLEGTAVFKNFLTPAKFSDVNAFIQSLQKLEIPVVALNALSDGEFEILFDIASTTIGYGKIVFNDKTSYEKTLENIRTIWKKKLVYIDARYGNKVYFKVQ